MTHLLKATAQAHKVLEEIDARLALKFRVKRPNDDVRRIHAEFIYARLDACCWACHNNIVLALDKLTLKRLSVFAYGAGVTHWYDEARAKLSETWGTCRQCALDIKRKPEFRQFAEPRFRDYQNMLGQWLAETGRKPPR